MEKEIIIQPGQGLKHYWEDLWSYRELFYFLAWRDILVRYKQTALGVAWSVLRPFLTMVVFTLVFGNLAKLPGNDGVPYAITVFAALLPWQFFANALPETGGSLLASAGMLTKVYFPRLIIPTSTVIVSVVDFLISFGILVMLMAYFRFIPDWRMFTMPLFFLMAVFATLGLGIFFSAVSVRYRDFRFITPFIVQIGLYLSPVGFVSSVVPEKWRLLYSCNPMVGVIDGFRWSIFGPERAPLYLPGLMASILVTIGVMILGLWYFRKVERSFADVI